MSDATTPARVALPRVLRLLWGWDEPQRRGPKPAHSLADIAAAAVRVADLDGLAAASLPRVARELGAGTTSLYRYIDTRADLDIAMLDHAYGLPPTRRAEREWRPQLRTWALANQAVLHAHPWLLDLPTPDPPLGPNRTAWTEAGLASFDNAPVTVDQQLNALLLVEIFVRGQTQLVRPTTGDTAQTATVEYSTQLAAVISRKSYPRLTNAVATGAFDRDAASPLIDGLDVLLQGLEQAWSATSR